MGLDNTQCYGKDEYNDRDRAAKMGLAQSTALEAGKAHEADMLKRLDRMTESQDGKIYSPSGATSRSKVIDFTLMIWEAVVAIVNRLQYGIDVGHEKDNWRRGKDDPIFIANRINHGMQHYQNLISGMRPDGTRADWTDVEAALCNLAMLTWWRRNGVGVEQAFPWLHDDGYRGSYGAICKGDNNLASLDKQAKSNSRFDEK